MAGSGGGGGAGGGAAGAGGTGGAGGGAGAGIAPEATPTIERAAIKAGQAEVIDDRGNSLGRFGQDGKPVTPNVNLTAKREGEQDELKLANDSVEPRGEATNDATRSNPMGIDAAAFARAPNKRSRDAKKEAEQLGLNGIEPAVKHKQKLVPETEAQPKATPNPASKEIGLDEMLTAPKPQVKPTIPPEIESRYLRVGNKYYRQADTTVVAFEDKGNKLETRSDSGQISDTLVLIARSRGWDEIKVSGSKDFRRQVWLEAASHGMQLKGYTPTDLDKAVLAKRSLELESSKVEKFRARETEAEASKQAMAVAMTEREARAQSFARKPAQEAVKDFPELAGVYAAMAAIEKQAEADNLTEKQRAVVRARVRQNIINAIERGGEIPDMKIRERTEVKREIEEEQELSR